MKEIIPRIEKPEYRWLVKVNGIVFAQCVTKKAARRLAALFKEPYFDQRYREDFTGNTRLPISRPPSHQDDGLQEVSWFTNVAPAGRRGGSSNLDGNGAFDFFT